MVGLVPLFSIVLREGGEGREGELSLSSLAAPLGGGVAKNHFSPRRFPYRKEEEERRKGEEKRKEKD